MYHISSHGSDDRTCGDTDTACRTLEYVLYLYYNTSNQYGLEIITSSDLTINNQIMVRVTNTFLIYIPCAICPEYNKTKMYYLQASKYPLL